MDKPSSLEARLIEEMSATISDIDTRIGENTDAVGTTTLFARLRQIVDTYLADGTVGLTALKALIDANQVDLDAIIVDTTIIESKVDAIQTDLDNATDGLGALKALIDANQVDLDSILVDTGNIETKVDANQVDLNTIISDTETLFQKVIKSITLSTGAVPVTEALFTVTGEVEAYIIGYIDTAVTSGGALTLEVGISSATAGLIAQTTVGNLLIDLLWIDATPATLVSKPSEKVISNGADIIHTIAGAAATAGAVTYHVWWRPLSSDGNIVAT